MPEENNEQTSGGLDIASQSGQTEIANAIRQALTNLGAQMSAAAVTAGNAATLAQSYSEGGTNTRTGENTDNAKYYYQQITSVISQFPSTDGTYILSVNNGSLSWVEVDDGDGGSY